jgi:hypothetical protein
MCVARVRNTSVLKHEAAVPRFLHLGLPQVFLLCHCWRCGPASTGSLRSVLLTHHRTARMLISYHASERPFLVNSPSSTLHEIMAIPERYPYIGDPCFLSKPNIKFRRIKSIIFSDIYCKTNHNLSLETLR